MLDDTSLKGKTILITGATGSFGRAFVKKLLENDLCEKVIVFSRDEWKQWEMRQSDPIFNHEKIRYFLGDVRDSKRLALAFREVDIVIHAAALKQVPAAEYNPTEFIQTNVHGAMNIIENALACGVQKVIALSTDKSVNPTNLYGATKLCSDKLFIAANSYSGKKGFPLFSVVRYGNVLGSRGSIIPTWKNMVIQGVKKLPITHPEMTRFWIKLDDCADFVLNRILDMKGAEIFVPKIPTISIVELAKAVAPELELEFVGIREGEKLHELLISQDEARYTLDMGNYYMLLPPTFNKSFEERCAGRGGVSVKEHFSYASEHNPEHLAGEDVLDFLTGSKTS